MHVTVRYKNRPGQTFAAIRWLGEIEDILIDVFKNANGEPVEVVMGEHSYTMTERPRSNPETLAPDATLTALRNAYEKDCRKQSRVRKKKVT